jgi:hypothetical protein
LTEARVALVWGLEAELSGANEQYRGGIISKYGFGSFFHCLKFAFKVFLPPILGFFIKTGNQHLRFCYIGRVAPFFCSIVLYLV